MRAGWGFFGDLAAGKASCLRLLARRDSSPQRVVYAKQPFCGTKQVLAISAATPIALRLRETLSLEVLAAIRLPARHDCIVHNDPT